MGGCQTRMAGILGSIITGGNTFSEWLFFAFTHGLNVNNANVNNGNID